MSWESYPAIAYISTALFILGAVLNTKSRLKVLRDISLFAGIATLVIFTIGLWVSLERPPMRTLAETRLWYSIFLTIAGLAIFYRWKMDWMLYYSIGMSILFVFINLLNPDTYDKTLMPALQSPWFVPHVIVYIIGYALLAASTLMGLHGLWLIYTKKTPEAVIERADNIVYIGFAFLTLGLLFGALWAKEAWGHYWTWDPKETWAFLTWFMYLVYIHLRYQHKKRYKWALWSLTFAFVILLIAWFGVNYLPTAENSVHTYST